jgi:catechol 2,3-dioxygenase-like lactoylglutathione lyase family enzyme
MSGETATGDRVRIGVSEVVLRTSWYDRLCAWYGEVLRQAPTLDLTPEANRGTTDPDLPTRMAFFDLPGEFPYTQRIAVFECLDVGSTARGSVGLHHLQLRFPHHESLFAAYRRLKPLGIMPAETDNHGIATSFYYRDPDYNRVELSALNFASLADVREYTTTDRFRRKPEGEPIDVEDLIRRHDAGERYTEMLMPSW